MRNAATVVAARRRRSRGFYVRCRYAHVDIRRPNGFALQLSGRLNVPTPISATPRRKRAALPTGQRTAPGQLQAQVGQTKSAQTRGSATLGAMATLADVVSSYRDYLSLRCVGATDSVSLRMFDRRLESTPEAAQTEAVVFEFLRSRSLAPTLHEDPSTGGNDFECSYYGQRFAVEATALRDDTLSGGSGIESELADVWGGLAVTATTVATLRGRISSKSAQASRYSGPRVLAIGATHLAADMLFGVAIPELLTGQSRITVPVGPTGPVGESYMSTYLKDAAHVRQRKDIAGIEAFRHAFSATLLIAIHGDGCTIRGLLNPEPEHPLPFRIFGNVWFARLQWPVIDNTLNVEWVAADPPHLQHDFSRIRVTEEELRKGVS